MVSIKKFSAAWCGPCRALAPVMNEIKQGYVGNTSVVFEEYDVDEAYEQSMKYGVRSVPTVIIEKDGKEVERFTGMSSKVAYVNAINENLK